ncbi:hypothetical protein WJX82_002585 [Trebouxia sp. C0006]
MGSSADVAGQGMLSRVGSAKTKRSSDRPAAPTAETIWVGVRIRPLSYLEHIHRDHDSWEASDEFTLRYIGEVDRSHAHLPPAYCYDRVFSNHTSSQQVYDAAAKDRVLSALQGLNATLFVYGQTGSGKTYTMRSVVQAAAQDIFHHIRHTPGMEYTLRMSAIEIYNEKVRDLLKDGTERQNLPLLDDPERGTVAEGLSEEWPRSEQHLCQLLRQIEARRTVRDTRQNAESSRSHQIVRIFVESRPSLPAMPEEEDRFESRNLDDSDAHSEATGTTEEDLRPVKVSTLNFVDLAGSERSTLAAKDDGDNKLRQTEGSAINKSLLTLGNVIRGLGDGRGRSHVPFRDSKLTRMLQASLGGNSRTAIICTISPAAGAADNTRVALHFANAAKRVTMQPHVNEVVNQKALLRKLRDEVALLRKQLATRDFAVEAAQLSEALAQKEEEVQMTAGQRDAAEKRLKNLERLLIRADPANKPHQRRATWDGSPGKPSPPPRTHPTSFTAHVDTPPPGAFASRAGLFPDVSPLMPHGHETYAYESSGQQVVEDRSTADALAALQAEVRCIKHTRATQQGEPLWGMDGDGGGARIARLEGQLAQMEEDRVIGEFLDAAKEETISALRAELARLQQSQHAQQAADSALASLQQKIDSLQGSQDLQSPFSGDPTFPPELISARHASPCRPDFPPSANPGRLQTLASGLSQQSDLTPQPSGSQHPLTPLATPPVQQGDSDPGHNSSSSKSKLANLMQRFGQLKKSDKKAEPAQARGAEGWGRGGTPEILTLGDDDDDDMVCMRSPSVSPLPKSPQPSSSSNIFKDDDKENSRDADNNRSQSHAGHMSNSYSSSLSFSLKIQGPQERSQGGKPSRLEVQSPSGQQARGRKEGERAAADKSKDAAAQWYRSEVQRLRNVFRSAVAGDVARLKEAVGEYKENTSRLECQKQLLLKQVLSLESRVAEHQQQQARFETQLQQSQLETQRAQRALRTAQQDAAGPAGLLDGALGGGLRGMPGLALRMQDQGSPGMLDTDSWAEPASVETLLPRIVQLWEDLHVPLVHRSRFYLAFKGRETFYYEAEHRRLIHQQTQMGLSVQDGDEASPRSKRIAEAETSKALRKLDWERRWLAAQMKWDFTSDERLELFTEFGVSSDGKERKLQLVRKLWAPDTIREIDGMTRSSEVVMRLNGCDATDGMFDLVFSRPQGEGWVRSMIAAGATTLAPVLGRMVSNPAGGPRPPSASKGSTSSMQSNKVEGRRKSFLGVFGLTPRRNSNATSAFSGGRTSRPQTPPAHP